MRNEDNNNTTSGNRGQGRFQVRGFGFYQQPVHYSNILNTGVQSVESTGVMNNKDYVKNNMNINLFVMIILL